MAAKHFHKELTKIKKLILSLGTLVEERVQKATKAIETKDAATARWLIESDHEINTMEVETEEECLKILALYQPVAVDLRFIIAVIKINNDLERIGDEAANIAERLGVILKHTSIRVTYDYTPMSEKAAAMLKKSLDALVNLDVDVAKEVIRMDDDIDRMDNAAYDQIKTYMNRTPEHMGYWINLMYISRHIERIADHAVNIAEEVIYMIEGEIVRHGHSPIEFH